MTTAALPTPLVSPEQLIAALAAGAAPVVIDCSFDLADVGAGERAYALGHLPGAIYAHLDRDLSAEKTGRNGRHPLPTRADWSSRLARLGVTPARAVVVYDAQGGMYAARAWWMLLWVGHRAVSVLDGGLPAWKAAGAAIESGEPQPVAALTPYPPAASLVKSIDADGVSKALGRLTLLDARAGHIPGARSRFFKDNLDSAGFFLPAAELRAAFDAFGAAPDTVVHQCGSGVTACHNLLAMAHAGLGHGLLYAGSWSEWSGDPARPIATG